MPKLFVTGGAGYVGAHCAKAFAARGWDVVVYDNLSAGWRDFVRWGPLIEGDVRDAEALARAVAAEKPDAVAHFAALTSVPDSVHLPSDYYRVNTVGALNLIDAMRAADVDKLVFSSTCAVYGHPQRVPLDEAHPCAPINPYGWSKLMVERMLADAAAAYGLNSVALRYFNASGASPDGEIGERHEPETHVIPLAIRGALDGGFTFTVFGTDYDTPDGSAIRDYIHVADLADAHCRAVEHLLGGGTTEVINLGSGRGASVLEIAAAVANETGGAVSQVLGPRRAGDAPMLVADAGKAARVLGWRPERSGVAQVVADAVAWARRDAAAPRSERV